MRKITWNNFLEILVISLYFTGKNLGYKKIALKNKKSLTIEEQ
jgi:hypothetical protein